ncbi:porin family protein, partial [Mycobacterium tuberculosis]|nr:porin family protein [Mycobacterium tuberculosis]
LETDFGYGSSDDTSGGGLYKAEATWEGTTRARAGYAFDKFLVYGTAGVAYADFETRYNGVSNDDWRIGWAAGGGLEYALNKNISVKGEYLYT